MTNGLSVRFRFNSDIFWASVGDGCEHFCSILLHVAHDFERSLCCWSLLNSWATVWLGTQPRSHRSEFSASFVRFFDRRNWGVSGTWKRIIKTKIKTIISIVSFHLVALTLLIKRLASKCVWQIELRAKFTYKIKRNRWNHGQHQTNHSRCSPRHITVQQKKHESSDCCINTWICAKNATRWWFTKWIRFCYYLWIEAKEFRPKRKTPNLIHNEADSKILTKFHPNKRWLVLASNLRKMILIR